jgi:hypothetical protein
VDGVPTWIRLLAISASTVGLVAALTHPASTLLPRLSTVESVIYLDPFTASAHDVESAHARHHEAICLLRGGVWEGHRPDAARFIRSLIGSVAPGGGRWLDVRAWSELAEPMSDRLALCASKRFDGVLFLDLDAWAQPSGFPLTHADQLRFNTALAQAAQGRGLQVSFAPIPATPRPANLR